MVYLTNALSIIKAKLTFERNSQPEKSMRFNYFKFQNFKGIESMHLDLSDNPSATVHTLVGLNESGKTTVLEAINYFLYKGENLEPLNLDRYNISDIHDIVPIGKRDNFNGKVSISAGIMLESEDIEEIKKVFQNEGISLIRIGNVISFTQTYPFLNSKHVPAKNEILWSNDFAGRMKGDRTVKKIPNSIASKAYNLIKSRLPKILYFPNFLFEFPGRIYLEESNDNKTDVFYRTVIQDILDSLKNDTNIETHIVARAKSSDDNERRNLESLINKMNQQLTTVIFDSWNQTFRNKITDKEVVTRVEKDPQHGVFIEFYIKDKVDTYQIGERSLGFRWFFVYLLLTQFRSSSEDQGRKNVMFLLDEPASNLHPSAQQELLKSFEKIPRIIYTTHSQYMINPLWLENTFVVKNDGIHYNKNENDYSSKETKISIHKYRKFVSDNPNQTSYFQPILEVLDYAPSQLEFIPNAVITEGKNDFYTFNLYHTLSETPRLNWLPGTSSSSMNVLISLYMGWGRPFIVLLDSDKEGKLQSKRYIDAYGPSVKDRIVCLHEIDPAWDGLELEDLFSERDKMGVIQACYPNSTSWRKDIFNRSVQELLLSKRRIELEENTRRNLDKVILRVTSYFAGNS